MRFRHNLNTLLYYLSRGVELKLKSGHTLAMAEDGEEPGFLMHSSDRGPIILQIGSDVAWMCLIDFAKKITDEELKALEPKVEQWEPDCVNIYLTKDGAIVGLHAIGDLHEGKFMQMEAWGNEYDEDHNMLGRGSFRVFNQIEEAAKEFEADGWVRREAPKKKEVTS